MAEDDLPPFPDSEDDPLETNGQIISRSLTSSRSGRAYPITRDLREREQARKETDSAWRKKMAEESIQLRRQAEQTAKQTANLKVAETRLSILEKQAGIRQKEEEVLHATTVFQELNALDYKDGRFPNLVADTFRRNPRALDNPRVAGYVDKLFSLHDQYLKDFRTDATTEAERNAAIAADAAAKKSGMKPTGVTTKTDGVTTRFEAPDEKPADRGSIRTTTKSDGTISTSTTRPLPAPGSPEERAALTEQHDTIEREVNDRSGKKQDPAKVAQLNALKAKLGYQQIDKDGKLAPPAASPSTPSASPAPVATPTLKPLPANVGDDARKAIAAGKDPEAVRKRLQENGYDSSGL